MKTIEEILRDRVKTIDEGEWTLLGTPDDVIKELEAHTTKLLNEQLDRLWDESEVMNSDVSPVYGVPLSAVEAERSKLEAEL